MGLESDTPRTIPGGSAVPDGTSVQIFRQTDLVTPVATVSVTGGKYTHSYDGAYGPIQTRVTYSGETRIRDSHAIGQAGPLNLGDLVHFVASQGHGVFANLRNALLVTAGGVGRRVLVRSGIGAAAGIIYNQFTDNKPSPEFDTNTSGQPRIDIIGFQVYTPGHAQEGRAELVILKGTAAASPVAPTPTQQYESGTWFEPLAEVLLAHNYSSIVSGNITDARVFAPQLPAGVGLPPGMIAPFAGAAAPTGWLLCNGAAVSRTAYAALYAVIGTSYGVGDGSTTFNVPDFRGRIPVGLDATQTEFDALNESGGAKTHTLSAAEAGVSSHTHDPGTLAIPSGGGHTHTYKSFAPTADSGSDTTVFASVVDPSATAASGTTDSGGDHAHGALSGATAAASTAGTPHNNLQPYRVVNYIIRATL